MTKQDEWEARLLLRQCIAQLDSSEIGDDDWLKATQILGQIDPEYVPMQIDALADDRYRVCRAIATALSRIGPSVFYDIIAAVSHEHQNVRQFAVGLLYGLAQRGDVVIEDAVPALANALLDPDCRVRHKTAVTLSFIGPQASAAIPNLIVSLSDEDDFVREWAAYALAAMGPLASEAIGPLTEALLDDEPCVRQAACEALQAC
jgi:HEAT repeat protein